MSIVARARKTANGFMIRDEIVAAQPVTEKVKDWFYAKNISRTVPSEKWTHILATVRETEKARLCILDGADCDGDFLGIVVWIPKSCIEEVA